MKIGTPYVSLGCVRVYLVGYIFCIIDCHICRDIFDSIDIIYYRLPYVSGGALTLKTLVIYIYQPRGTMQYNQQLYVIYSSNIVIGAQGFFLSSKSSTAFNRTAPRGSAPSSPWILLIWQLSSLSRRHALVYWKVPLAGGEDAPSSTSSTRNTSM
jgi:hypothetical protein